MLIFRGFLPSVGETGTAYLPWAMLCAGLTSLAAVQVVVARKVNRYYKRAMKGEGRAGRVLVSRRNTAEWNNKVRSFCKSRGLLIVRRNDNSASDVIDEDQA